MKLKPPVLGASFAKLKAEGAAGVDDAPFVLPKSPLRELAGLDAGAAVVEAELPKRLPGAADVFGPKIEVVRGGGTLGVGLAGSACLGKSSVESISESLGVEGSAFAASVRALPKFSPNNEDLGPLD